MADPSRDDPPGAPTVNTLLADNAGPVTAAAWNGNVHATQFHPEKSGRGGLAVLENFVKLAAGVPAAVEEHQQ